MLTLSLCWVGIGLIVGLLANLAGLRSGYWAQRSWLWLMGLGMITALGGGWLGTLLMGRLFATAMALWIAIAGTVLISLAVTYLGTRGQRS